ncbi:LPS-assembly protein LptD [Aureimonas mangrovi]|uniref:LPS-assembly protein LptD n=1 Tax=Aureimonas mangrovi TaxID=2758041 RepID=UPI001FE3A4F0|nr:LPS-assembly protein LptD [Aureimonas mangrovi]
MGPRGISSRAMVAQRPFARLALLTGVALFALAAGGNALAQPSVGGLGSNVSVPEGTQLFLEADTVTYDSERSVVTAAGGVQIDYGDYQLVAREVVYDQNTRRLLARGDVELIEPGGNRIYSDAVDITDDFADGFITALRIETPENTRFAASQAVRREGEVTTFERGVYTACEACAERPDRPPLWQVKAKRIVWDQGDEVVRYYGARFELFGLPLAYLPYFATPDSQAQRQSGFLMPEIRQSDETGTGVRVPYFWAISEDKDLTVAGTYYSNQGFLGEAEYRQAFQSGYFTLQVAGISQDNPGDFNDFRADGVNPPEFDVTPGDRGMIGTTGRFALNERWTFGWDILAQSDPNFSNVYEIANFDDVYRTSEIYLTGLGDKSFFDLRAQKFDVQSINTFTEELQPWALPSLDYEYISESPVMGGEVEFDVNVASLRRDETSPSGILVCREGFIIDGACNGSLGFPFRDDVFRYRGMEGDYTRATAEASWRTSFTTEQGLVLTPSLSTRGDLYTADMSTDPYLAGTPNALGGVDISETGARGMATAAIEARYPWLIETANSSHVIEPIAQLLVRPDEMDAGMLPNEDAQSLVFNTTNLFAHDRFSGYDRIEGGTRANVGVQYSGVMGTGYQIDAAVGQSFHLFGENPFEQQDLALVGYDSGLESDRSDYVASVGLTLPVGVSLAVQSRFDEESLDMERADVSASANFGRLASSLTYSQIADQPTYGFAEDRQQVSANASFRVTDEIVTFGSIGYDIENSSVISRSFGVGYADECFSLLAEYRMTNDRYQLESAESQVLFRLSLRTLAEAEYSFDVDGDEDRF